MARLFPTQMRRFMAVLVTTLLLSWLAAAQAETRNTVGRISAAELEQIMGDTNCRCLIVAMAAWCKPCRKELPALNRLYEKYKGSGVRVVGISLDHSGPKAMQPIVDRLKVTFPVYWVGEDAMADYDIYAVPMLFFIRDGKTVEKVVGQRSEAFLEQKIVELLDD